MTGETAREDGGIGAPQKRAGVPRSIDGIIGRLEGLTAAPKRPSPETILGAFPKKRVLVTNPEQRSKIAELLAELDLSWAVRATLVVTGRPEQGGDSTATLRHYLSAAARAETGFPQSGDHAGLITWATELTDPRSSSTDSMPWIGLAALWPDRASLPAAGLLGTLLYGGLAREVKRGMTPAETTFTLIVDQKRRSATVRGLRWLLEPPRGDAGTARRDLEFARHDLEASARRNARLEAELGDLRLRVLDAESQLEAATAERDAAERRAETAEEQRSRDVHQAHGRAAGEQSRIASSYGRRLLGLADDADDYLNRTSPNVGGARNRIDDLRELARRLLEEAG